MLTRRFSRRIILAVRVSDDVVWRVEIDGCDVERAIKKRRGKRTIQQCEMYFVARQPYFAGRLKGRIASGPNYIFILLLYY